MRFSRAGLSAVVVAAIAVATHGVGTAQEPSFAFEVPDTEGMRWYKGNTHTHTLESDGDSPPELVARWYKEHGYAWLVLSDHNVLTDPATVAHLVDDLFLVIPGEEVSASHGRAAVHVNGLNLEHFVEPQEGRTLVDTIQRNVDAIREVNGVPHINHPNFLWSIGAEDLARVQNDRLLEIHSGHPIVHSEGGGGVMGMEQVWDALLTRGKRVYGISVDDAHTFQAWGPEYANPGRGWVVVKSRGLAAAEIVANLEQGLFYASDGVELEDVVVQPRRLEVRIRQDRDFKYTTHFYGAGGRLLAESIDNPAAFELQTPELYVRAVVRDSGGRRAWVQPAFVTGR